MKLLTHNMLTSNMIKGVKNGFPLLLNVKESSINTVEYDESLMLKLIPRLCWSTFVNAVKNIEPQNVLPLDLPQDYENQQDLLKTTYKYLINYEIIEGELKCPETGHIFPIENGIVNMLTKKE